MDDEDFYTVLYHCRKCVYSAPTKEELKTHIKSHTAEPKITCKECTYSASDLNDLKDHVSIQHKLKNRCVDCRFKAKNDQELKRHRLNEHPYSCIECAFTSNTDALLRAHIKEKHFARIYVCTECEYSSRLFSLYMKHIKEHYSPTNKFKCVECHFSAKTKTELETHSKTHIVKHKCPECIETFDDLYQLQVHVSIHNAVIKDHKCHICGKEFAKPYALKRHIIVHSTEKFNCPKCSFSTKYKSSFNSHVNNNCGKKIQKTDPTYKRKAKQRKLFQCTECFMSFLQDKHLRNHIRQLHLGPLKTKKNLRSKKRIDSHFGTELILNSNLTPPSSMDNEKIVFSVSLDGEEKTLYIDA